MDIDGADFDDTNGFASIDEDASDEPTKILMIVGLQETLTAKDVGLALDAHFGPMLINEVQGSSSKPWLSKVFNIHTIPARKADGVINTGKAFAVCADVRIAERVLNIFEEQYLDADVDTGFRLKLTQESASRLRRETGRSEEETITTDQLLICYASSSVLHQCRPEDPRREGSSVSVELDWGQAHFSYHDPSFGVRCWDAAAELPGMAAGQGGDHQTGVQRIESALAVTQAGDEPAKKRSRSALIREELRANAQRRQQAETDATSIATACRQAKIDLIVEQLSYGVPIRIPPDLQTTIDDLGIKVNGNGPASAAHGAGSASFEQASTVAKGSSLYSTPAAADVTSVGSVRVGSLMPVLPRTANASKKASVSGPLPLSFLPARPSIETIEAADKLTKVSDALSPSSKTRPSVAAAEERAVRAPPDVLSGAEVHHYGDRDRMDTRIDGPTTSRWDIKDGVSSATSPMGHKAPSKKDKIELANTEYQSSRGSATATASSTREALATSLMTQQVKNQPSSTPTTATLLEVPSGMRLPPPMEGLTRSLGGPSDEVPINFDFCNQDRMLCLLCLRQFKSPLTLRKHVNESQLHKSNLQSAETRRAGAHQLIQSYRSSRTPTTTSTGHLSSTGPSVVVSQTSAGTATSSMPSNATPHGPSETTTQTMSPGTVTTYRDRSLERRAVYGHGGV